MPITLENYVLASGSFDIIQVEFLDGDPKGDSWDNPYTLDNIITVSDAENWDPPVTKEGSQYQFPYSLWILGTNTFFTAEDCQLDFEYFDFWRFRFSDCYIRCRDVKIEGTDKEPITLNFIIDPGEQTWEGIAEYMQQSIAGNVSSIQITGKISQSQVKGTVTVETDVEGEVSEDNEVSGEVSKETNVQGTIL